MLEHGDEIRTWPIVGQFRRFVPVSHTVVEGLERFCRSKRELWRVHATLLAIANQEMPAHPKLAKMHGANLYEFGDFGRRGQGRIYLYRTELSGKDTFLMCAFHQKKTDETPDGLEGRTTKVAQDYIEGRESTDGSPARRPQ